MIETGKKLTVVIPGYNEGSVIYQNLLETVRAVRDMADDYEIIFVNDGSQDDTLQNARQAAAECNRIKVIDCARNGGKGSALKIGVEKASGDYIAFLDADLDLHPSQLNRFIQILHDQQADVVIGSKWHPESVVDYPMRRKILSFGYFLLLLSLFRLNIKDTQTGLKLFKAEAIKPTLQKFLVRGYAYDIEVLAVINHFGKKIVDAPITLIFSRSKHWGRIKIRDIYAVMLDTMAVFYRLYLLKYYDQ